MTRPDAIPVLVNANAGGGDPGATRGLEALLREQGRELEVQLLPADQLPAEVRRHASAGAARIGVGGGDGTMRAAAQVLVGTSTILVPLPMGTLNRFPRRLGIDSLRQGVNRLDEPKVSRIPVGIADDTVFLNTATFGLYGEIVRRRDRLARWISRWPAAGLVLIHALARLRTFEVEVELPHARLSRDTPLVWLRTVWNGGDEPHLELVVLRVSGRADLAAFLVRRGARIARGEIPEEDPRVEVLRTRSLVIRARHAIDVTLDGESFRWTPPFFVAIEDAALWVAASPNVEQSG